MRFCKPSLRERGDTWIRWRVANDTITSWMIGNRQNTVAGKYAQCGSSGFKPKSEWDWVLDDEDETTFWRQDQFYYADMGKDCKVKGSD
jgi:hypothetical protein